MGEMGWSLVVGIVTVGLVAAFLLWGMGVLFVFAALAGVALLGRLLMRLGGGSDGVG